MRVMYSPSTQGFYPFNEEDQQEYINAGSLPDDLVLMDEQLYTDFFNPMAGKYGAWVDGVPTILDIPEPDYEAINTVKRENLMNAALSTVAAINTKINMGRKLTQTETDKMNSVLDYCDLLSSLDMSISNIDWPELPNS